MSPMDLNPKDTVPIEKRGPHSVCRRCGSKVDPATGRCTDKACGLIQRHDISQSDRDTSPRTADASPTRQRGTAYQKPMDVPATTPQYVCPNCGTSASTAQGRCPNQRGCGYSGFMKRIDIQQLTTGIESTATSTTSAPVGYPPTAKDFLAGIEKTPAAVESPMPTKRSPLLEDIEREGAKGRGFPKREKQEKRSKRRTDFESIDWHIPSIRRFVKPALAGLLLLVIAASLVFVVVRLIIPPVSQFIAKTTSTAPAPVAPTPIPPYTPPDSYTLSIAINPPEGGSVPGFAEGNPYAPDTEITLTAEPAPGYTFDRWEGDISGTSSSATIIVVVDSNKNINAYFVDTAKPVISPDVLVTDITDLSATVIWATSEVTTGYVKYGVTEVLEKTTDSTSGQAENHIATLRGLSPNTRYYLQIWSLDLSGNEAYSEIDNFRTGHTIATGDQVGTRAPGFTLQSYEDNRNSDSPNNPSSPYWKETISLSDFRGKTVIVNFWSTYCGACLLEFPIIRELYQIEANMNTSDDLAVITVCTDDPSAGIRRIPGIEDKFSGQIGRFLFPILLDKEQKEQRIINKEILIQEGKYNLHEVPTTMFIGKDGIIAYVKIGAFETKDEVLSILNRSL